MYAQHSSQTIPPESFMSPPLTPPATDEKTETTVSRVIAEIGRKREHILSTDEPWLGFELDVQQYRDLQRQLRKDSSLWHRFEHIRYVVARSFTALLM